MDCTQKLPSINVQNHTQIEAYGSYTYKTDMVSKNCTVLDMKFKKVVGVCVSRSYGWD